AAGGKRMGLVSAAIQILADAGADATMNCHELVKLATERGLWQPRAGKTPAASLYAAIFREIKQRGEASRFRKTDRGKFALNKTS
ncbi:MAG TPA: winged helix-turn-helix domain-containing protein, partial [Planctomycetota bacterium]|nr:winged helix-turn-helix domain-containing protein [Planctomycetota bacterium]